MIFSFTRSRRYGVSLVAFFVVLFVTCTVICQDSKTVTKVSGSGVTINTYTEIPEAAEPCTPDECDWWKQLRQAGNNLLRKGDEKSKREFVTLFVVGLEKSYRVPVKDRPSLSLATVRPGQPRKGVIPRNGKVELSIEVRADGSVGDVKVIKSLRSDMDRLCIQPQGQSIFLPAVKDHAFVTEWQNASCSFWSQKGM